jgi:hypothetical protein
MPEGVVDFLETVDVDKGERNHIGRRRMRFPAGEDGLFRIWSMQKRLQIPVSASVRADTNKILPAFFRAPRRRVTGSVRK